MNSEHNEGREELKYSNLICEEEVMTKKNETDTAHAKDFYDNPFNSPNHMSLTTENESLPIKEWRNHD